MGRPTPTTKLERDEQTFWRLTARENEGRAVVDCVLHARPPKGKQGAPVAVGLGLTATPEQWREIASTAATLAAQREEHAS
jgi:hypothetical protein